MRRRVIWLLLIGSLVSCHARAPERPLKGWLAKGCTSVLSASECEAKVGDLLAIWVPTDPRAELTLEIAERPIETSTSTSTSGAGALIGFKVPSGGGPLSLKVRTATLTESIEFHLAIVETSTPAAPRRATAYRHLQAARSAMRRDDIERARIELDAGLAVEGRGAFIDRRLQIIAAHLEAFLLDEPMEASARASTWTDSMPLDGEGRAMTVIVQGQVASRLGDWRSADALLVEAEQIAIRLALPSLAIARQERALALTDAGQLGPAEVAIRRALGDAHNLPPCLEADLTNSLGWVQLQARRDLDGARTNLLKAISIYDGACGSISGANNARLNLALLHEELGRLDLASEALLGVHGAEVALARLWRQGLEARIQFARGDQVGARRSFATLARAADAAAMEAIAWQAQVGLGRVAEASGQYASAIEAFQRAEQLLERQAQRAPIDRGQFSLGEDRPESADGLIRVLLKLGKVDDAFAVARRARRRAIQQMGARDRLVRMAPEQRRESETRIANYRRARAKLEQALAEQWEGSVEEDQRRNRSLEAARRATQRSLDEALHSLIDDQALTTLRSPEDGEVMLLARPLGGAFVAWAATTTTVKNAILVDLGASAWQGAFGTEIAGAQLISILAAGAPGGVGLHSARVDGEPLLSQHRIEYSIDLPVIRRTNTRRRALVISDPRGDLPQARLEVAAIVGSMQRWEVQRIDGRAATRERIVAEMPSADLLHFAGHGRQAGAEGWQSGLLLANGELVMGDILTSTSAPRFVVLSACEGAESPAFERSIGLGLAQAFLLAGSEAVIAAGPSIDDQAAREFSSRLYREWSEGIPLSEAYRRTAVALEGAGLAWQEFRFVTR